jgi:peptide chain release factor
MIWIQLSAARGPSECARAVALLSREFGNAARENKTDLHVIEKILGVESDTFQSIVYALSDEAAPAWLSCWLGTVQWVAKSPYRPNHRRKNWFVSIQVIEPIASTSFSISNVHFETFRSSGPGGQHVNKTESAVRAIHKPSGTVAVSQDGRSQHENRQIALERLKRKIQTQNENNQANSRQLLWNEHNNLVRGKAIMTFVGLEFRRR